MAVNNLSATQRAGYSGNPNAFQDANTNNGAATTTTTTTQDATTPTVPLINPETYLYDVGLQNIFQDYQQNVQTLSQAQQQSLQDAYYIREMSKKYLGEYASNVGIGDVSGNLLDIYGQYQQTVAGINTQFGGAELSLQQQYNQQRRELEAGRTMAESLGEQEQVTAWASISSPTSFDINGEPMPNPNYDESFDINYYGKPEDWNDEVSDVFRDAAGNYAYIGTSIDDDKTGAFAEDVSLDVFESFQTENGRSAVAGDTHIYKGETFVLKNGQWYQLKSLGNRSPQYISTLMEQQQNPESWGTFTDISNLFNSEDISKKNIGAYKEGNLYVINLESGVGRTNDQPGPLAYYFDAAGTDDFKGFEVNSQTTGTNREIVDTFKEVHGSLKAGTAITYNGRMYFYHTDGKVYEMKRRDYKEGNN